MSYAPVPIDEAQAISEAYAKAMVVIVSYDRVYQRTHTTTFGQTAFDKANAAVCADLCAQALGCDLGTKKSHEHFADLYTPALHKEATDLLIEISRRGGTTVPMLGRIEQYLKSMGHALRRG